MKLNLWKYLGILIFILGLNVLFKHINTNFFESSYEFKTIYKGVLVLITILFLKKYNFIRHFKQERKSIVFTLVSMVALVYSFYYMQNDIIETNYNISLNNQVFFFCSTLFVGAFEELFFRVFTFYYLFNYFQNNKNKLLKTILCSSSIFAIVHLNNIFNSETFVLSVINQVFFAFGIGIFFQSLYLRFKNIFLIVALHTLVNYFGSYKTRLLKLESSIEPTYTFDEFLSTFLNISILTVVVFIPISYFIVRKKLKENNPQLNLSEK